MPLDVGVGLILGVGLSNVTDLAYPLCLLIGIAAALLPDLDFLYQYAKTRRTPNTEHRDGLHYPLIVTPIVGLAGWIFNPHVGAVMAAGTLAHFIHDSIGVGFGIKWLYPFKENSYLFFFQVKNPANKNMPKQRLYSWNDKERAEAIHKYAYKDWIRFLYFRPNAYGLFEYIVFLTGVLISLASY